MMRCHNFMEGTQFCRQPYWTKRACDTTGRSYPARCSIRSSVFLREQRALLFCFRADPGCGLVPSRHVGHDDLAVDLADVAGSAGGSALVVYRRLLERTARACGPAESESRPEPTPPVIRRAIPDRVPPPVVPLEERVQQEGRESRALRGTPFHVLQLRQGASDTPRHSGDGGGRFGPRLER
jgi:hypothetical protein